VEEEMVEEERVVEVLVVEESDLLEVEALVEVA